MNVTTHLHILTSQYWGLKVFTYVSVHHWRYGYIFVKSYNNPLWWDCDSGIKVAKILYVPKPHWMFLASAIPQLIFRSISYNSTGFSIRVRLIFTLYQNKYLKKFN